MSKKISLKINNGGLDHQTDVQRTYVARFVRAGAVRTAGNQPSNIFIESDALQKACEEGLFDSRPVFVNHAGLWEYPSINNLVGVTRAAIWEPSEKVITGEIRLYDVPLAKSIANLLDQLLSETNPPDIGLSMVFYPEWDQNPGKAEENDGETDFFQRITGITHIESIDLVFEPAADGRVLKALSSQSNNLTTHGGTALKQEDSNHQEGKNLENQISQPLLPEAADCEEAISTESMPHDHWLDALGKSTADAMIQACGLPEATKEHLRLKTFSSPEDVKEAIESERSYLAQLQEDSVINLPGTPPRSPSITGMRTSLDQLAIAVESLLAGTRAPEVHPLSGIRELYHLLSGDYEMTGLYHPERITLANVNSSTMAGLVANALNKRVVNEFQQYPHWWNSIITVEDFSNLQTVRWITLGGIGELPTVSEGAAYTELTWDDVTETAAFVKKGGYLGITLEAIDKDDTSRLRAAPRALAQAAWLTLSKALSSIFTANSGVGPTMSDSLALFHSSHANLGSTALSVSSYAAARTAMRKQTELNSGERLGALTAPKFLLVPPDLEITALQVLASEYDYTYTLSDGQAAPVNALADGDTFNARMNAARNRVIVVDLWTDTNNWAASADPRLYPTIGLAFRYGRTPEIFSVASPTAGLMFTNDTMPIKVRFFFATGPVDYRGLYKANVA
jgi:hypothetical protein